MQSTGQDQSFVFTSSIAYGYTFKRLPVRAELEYSFRNKAKFNDLGLWPNTEIQTNAELKNQSLMANFYYDFKNTSLFTPYITVGLGASLNKLKVQATGDSADDYANNRKTDFAWSVGAGVSYQINEKVDVDLAYKYIDLGQIEATHFYRSIGSEYTFNETSQYNAKLKNNDISIGLRNEF